MPLDTLITGRIATLRGTTGFGWVEAIGIRDGRVAFAGTEVALETRADPFTVRIQLEPDQVAVPGLTDAHLHLAQAAMATRHVDLSTSPSLEDGLARIRSAHEALDDQVPAQLYRPSLQPYPTRLEPVHYPGHFEVRRVRTDGTIKCFGQLLFVSSALCAEFLGLEEVDDGVWTIWFMNHLLGRLDARTMKITYLRV